MFGKKKSKKKASQKDKKPDVAELLEQGAVRAIVTFEVVGKPKAHVESALKEYMGNIKNDVRITVLSEDYAEAIEQDEMFSTFCEAELIINEMNTLIWLAVNFSPASVEILEPAEKVLSAAELNAWVNDLLSKLHEVSTEYRSTLQKNKILNTSLNGLINNAILTALDKEPLTGEALQKKIGIHKDQLAPFLEHLVKKERIKETKGKYSLQ